MTKFKEENFWLKRDHNQLSGERREIRGQSPDLKSHLVPIWNRIDGRVTNQFLSNFMIENFLYLVKHLSASRGEQSFLLWKKHSFKKASVYWWTIEEKILIPQTVEVVGWFLMSSNQLKTSRTKLLLHVRYKMCEIVRLWGVWDCEIVILVRSVRGCLCRGNIWYRLLPCSSEGPAEPPTRQLWEPWQPVLSSQCCHSLLLLGASSACGSSSQLSRNTQSGLLYHFRSCQ